MGSEEQVESFSEKIQRGLDLYFRRLVEKYAKEDGELVFSENKKIVRVKARELLKTLNQECETDQDKH